MFSHSDKIKVISSGFFQFMDSVLCHLVILRMSFRNNGTFNNIFCGSLMELF